MSGCRKLDDQQLGELGELRERGKSLGFLSQIARQRWGVQISSNALSWQMLRIGADLPPARRGVIAKPGPAVVKRGNHVVRRYLPDEDRQLLELEAQGLGNTAIGKALGRRPNSIRGRLMTLARHAQRREDQL